MNIISMFLEKQKQEFVYLVTLRETNYGDIYSYANIFNSIEKAKKFLAKQVEFSILEIIEEEECTREDIEKREFLKDMEIELEYDSRYYSFSICRMPMNNKFFTEI